MFRKRIRVVRNPRKQGKSRVSESYPKGVLALRNRRLKVRILLGVLENQGFRDGDFRLCTKLCTKPPGLPGGFSVSSGAKIALRRDVPASHPAQHPRNRARRSACSRVHDSSSASSRFASVRGCSRLRHRPCPTSNTRAQLILQRAGVLPVLTVLGSGSGAGVVPADPTLDDCSTAGASPAGSVPTDPAAQIATVSSLVSRSEDARAVGGRPTSRRARTHARFHLSDQPDRPAENSGRLPAGRHPAPRLPAELGVGRGPDQRANRFGVAGLPGRGVDVPGHRRRHRLQTPPGGRGTGGGYRYQPPVAPLGRPAAGHLALPGHPPREGGGDADGEEEAGATLVLPRHPQGPRPGRRPRGGGGRRARGQNRPLGVRPRRAARPVYPGEGVRGVDVPGVPGVRLGQVAGRVRRALGGGRPQGRPAGVPGV